MNKLMAQLRTELDETFGPLAGKYVTNFFGVDRDATYEELPRDMCESTYDVVHLNFPDGPGDVSPPRVDVTVEHVPLQVFCFYGRYFRVGYSKVTHTLYYKQLR